jgi:hypothetical protein
MTNFEACSASRTQHENNLLTADNQGNFSCPFVCLAASLSFTTRYNFSTLFPDYHASITLSTHGAQFEVPLSEENFESGS